MADFINHYACSECGAHWTDEWSCMCDDRCPDCNTSISPYFSKELGEKAETDEETEEEHDLRLRRISKEVKADMDAGRYRHGQLRPEISAKQTKRIVSTEINPEDFHDRKRRIIDLMMTNPLRTITGRMTRDHLSFFEMYGGYRIDSLIMDESQYIKPEKYWLDSKPRDKGQEKDGPKTTYWTQPIPDTKATKPVSSPSEELRAKRRAKRKKKK